VCHWAALQTEIDAQQTNAMVKRLRSEKGSLNSALVNAQEALQHAQSENQKLDNMLKLEEGASSQVASASPLNRHLCASDALMGDMPGSARGKRGSAQNSAPRS
jgi:hypothetical protein